MKIDGKGARCPASRSARRTKTSKSPRAWTRRRTRRALRSHSVGPAVAASPSSGTGPQPGRQRFVPAEGEAQGRRAATVILKVTATNRAPRARRPGDRVERRRGARALGSKTKPVKPPAVKLSSFSRPFDFRTATDEPYVVSTQNSGDASPAHRAADPNPVHGVRVEDRRRRVGGRASSTRKQTRGDARASRTARRPTRGLSRCWCGRR